MGPHYEVVFHIGQFSFWMQFLKVYVSKANSVIRAQLVMFD